MDLRGIKRSIPALPLDSETPPEAAFQLFADKETRTAFDLCKFLGREACPLGDSRWRKSLLLSDVANSETHGFRHFKIPRK